MVTELSERQVRRNQAIILIEYVSFSVGMSFLGPTTLLPTLVRLLGGSPVVVGALGAIQSGAWLLPQLFVGRLVANRPLIKKHVVVPAAVSRACLGLIPLSLLFLSRRAPNAALGALLLAVAAFSISDAIASVPWFDLMAKAVPLERRGRVMGAAQSLSSLLGIGVGVVVEAVLARPEPFPRGYALLTFLGALGCGMSPFLLSLIREVPGPSQSCRQPSWREYLSHLREILRTDVRFAWLTILRWVAGLADMGGAFYVLYATDRLGLPQEMIGPFISAGVVGSMLSGAVLGPLTDRKGNVPVMQILIGLRCLLPMLALLAPLVAGRYPWLAAGIFVLIFALMGMVGGAAMLGFMNYLLEIAPAGERPMYIGLSNTLGGLLLLAPLCAGWLVQVASYEALFIVTLGLAILGLLLALRGPALVVHRQVAP